jgi:hypothetical protein
MLVAEDSRWRDLLDIGEFVKSDCPAPGCVVSSSYSLCNKLRQNYLDS